MIILKQNKRLIVTLGVFLLIFTSVFLINSFNTYSTNNIDINPFIKEMPLKYSSLIEKSKEINESYSGIIYENGITNELIIFKEFPTIDERETDFTLNIVYTTNRQKEKEQKVTLINTNKGVLYNYNNKAYGVFIKELPIVLIKEIEVIIHKYRTAKGEWETTIKSLNRGNPKTLSYRNEDYINYSLPNTYTYYYLQLLDSIEIKYLPYSYDIKRDSLFQITQSLSSYLKENNASIATIKNPDLFWQAINNNTDSLFSKVTFIGEGSKLINTHIKSLINKKTRINEIIDLTKLSNYFTLNSVFTGGCDESLHLIYNSITKLLEPFYVGSNCLGELAKIVRAPKLTASSFLDIYIKSVDSITTFPLLKINIDYYKQELALINSYYPDQIYNYHTLLVNNNLLKNSLFASTFISTELISIKNNNLKLSIRNVSNFPIQIRALNYKLKKRITTLNPTQKINNGQKIVVDIPLPRSFENLFVHKKSKTTGFKLSKDIYDLRILFSVIGLDTIHMASIRPYESIEYVENDLFRQKQNIYSRKEIVINSEKKEITFLDSVTINTPLVIPPGYVLKAKEGTKINIIEGGKIVSNSPLKFIGTKENPINIYSSDKKGQGILVLAEDRNSYFKHVFISDLTNPSHGNWIITGALTFYESPVKLEYVTINNNRSEDALNIVRTNFLISHCTISNTQSDAFDGDFVEGIVKDSYFTNLGNDAIDISGSDIIIKNVTINEAGDKGLSAGENSKMKINNVTIRNCEIGVAGKDLSIVNGNKITIVNNKLAFTAFKKKPEFGPSHITLSEVKLERVETIYLIENLSSLIINGEKAETIKNVKGKMYGVEFGKSSKETKISQ